jgi:hypothetical protein
VHQYRERWKGRNRTEREREHWNLWMRLRKRERERTSWNSFLKGQTKAINVGG